MEGNFPIRGDQTRLRECFLNLAGNAVRYTPAGGTVTLSLRQEDGYYLAAVSDTGIGIPVKHLPHISSNASTGWNRKGRKMTAERG
jgi:signal transduction histidine kinase